MSANTTITTAHNMRVAKDGSPHSTITICLAVPCRGKDPSTGPANHTLSHCLLSSVSKVAACRTPSCYRKTRVPSSIVTMYLLTILSACDSAKVLPVVPLAPLG